MRYAQIRMITIVGFLALPVSGCAIEATSEVEETEPVQATEQALTDLPDLVVESFTLADVTGGVLMTAVIKNQGTAASSYTGPAFVNYRQYVTPYQPSGCSGFFATWGPNLVPLAAGASQTYTTTNLGWTVSALESCTGTWYTKVDSGNYVAESDETNNVKYGRD